MPHSRAAAVQAPGERRTLVKIWSPRCTMMARTAGTEPPQSAPSADRRQGGKTR